MFINLLFIITFFVASHGYQLKQVIVLSRHNIRTPFHPNSDLEVWSPKKWPFWSEDPGNLTPKGRQLERSLGKYFADWMIQEQLFNNNCPKDQVFVYANNVQRTIETSKSFVEGAFGNCVNIYHKNITKMDPVFKIKLTNASTEFIETVRNEMYKKITNVDLKNEFLELNRILDIENSSSCKTENVCDLNEVNSEIDLKFNETPTVSGPLKIAWSILDSFLMAYYDGMAAENVAWGQIQTIKQWSTLMKIAKIYQELRFETKILDKELVTPLLKYLTDIFQSGKKKFYFLVGHDANISLLTSSLRFKDYVLHDQIERTPIGGKLVFQKWYDEINDQDWLRVNYVYQSTKQIRDGAEISLQNPPQWEILEMENCTVDKNGFCPWYDFMNILMSV